MKFWVAFYAAHLLLLVILAGTLWVATFAARLVARDVHGWFVQHRRIVRRRTPQPRHVHVLDPDPARHGGAT